MLEPVAIQSILLATMAGAMTVLLGAAYAFLYALAKLHKRPRLLAMGYVCYLLMAACVAVLAVSLNLVGSWSVIVVVMLVGYLLAPQAIWRLCVGTHAIEQEEIPAPLERSVES